MRETHNDAIKILDGTFLRERLLVHITENIDAALDLYASVNCFMLQQLAARRC